jgi:hypothetical protein
MAAEQAENGLETIDDLASFLVDNPEADETEDAPNADEPDDSDNSGSDNTEDAPADDDGEEPDSEDAEKPTSDLKFKVPVKSEDGTESIVEVDQKELIAGYQRHSDYTRKTQELSRKETEAFQVVTTEIEKSRSYFVEQAQLAHEAVRQLAGLRTPQEMAQLAHSDPAMYVQERARAESIQGVLSQLEQGVTQQRQQTQQQAAQAQAQRYQKTWAELNKDGIDKPKLESIFKTISTKYGLGADRLAGVDDPVVVRIMRDAAAYNDLKDKKASVTKKLQDAPKLPAQRQAAPKNEQRTKQLNSRFTSGKAKLGDLASWLENN